MNFFSLRPKSAPKIYGYTEPSADYKGLIKVGYTERDVLIRMQSFIEKLCSQFSKTRRFRTLGGKFI